jgi:hypothetical protein
MSDIEPQGQHHGNGNGHEPTDVKIRGILVFAIILTVATGLIQLGLGLWSEGFSEDEERAIAALPERAKDVTGQFPSPRLQGNPGGDMARYRAREDARLARYGWVDRKAGIAHIPIDRAMDALAKRGLPARKAPPGAP